MNLLELKKIDIFHKKLISGIYVKETDFKEFQKQICGLLKTNFGKLYCFTKTKSKISFVIHAFVQDFESKNWYIAHVVKI